MTGLEREKEMSIEAEMSVIGGILLKPELYTEAAKTLGGGDFCAEINRLAFGAAGELFSQTGAVDLVTLVDRITAKEPFEDKGRAKEYLVRAADTLPVLEHFGEYCKIVLERSLARQAKAAAYEAYQNGFYGEDTRANIQAAAEKLAELARDNARRSARSLSEILIDLQADIFGDAPDLSLSTGVATLDKLLDGVYPGDLVTVAAGTGVGKTAFALQLVRSIARSGKRVLLYSQEMTDKQNVLRMLARETGIELWKLKKSGRLDDAEAAQVIEACGELYKLPVSINDAGGVTVEQLRLDCVSMRDVDAIFIDHVGLMRGSKGARSRYEEITQIMIELRALALQIQKPIFILSQFNREGSKQKAEPDLSSFRDSGEIEQSSSACILLWRLADYDESGMLGVKVAKNRQGGTGKLYMRFDAPRMNFFEVINYAPKKGAVYGREMEDVFG